MRRLSESDTEQHNRWEWGPHPRSSDAPEGKVGPSMPSNATAELRGRGDGSTGAAPLMLCPTPRNALLRGERRLQRPEPKGSASRWNTGTGDTGAVAIAQAWHPFPAAARRAQPTAAAKPPLLRTQSCKSHALTLQITRPEGVGPPQADPGQSWTRATSTVERGVATDPQNLPPPSLRELGDGAAHPSSG